MAKKPSTSRGEMSQFGLFQVPEVPRPYKKAVQVVHSKPRGQLSLLQRKVSNAWLKNATQNEADPEGWWSLRIQDMASDIGFDSKNGAYLKESAYELMRVVFEWDVIAPEGKRVKWKASVLFPDIEITSEHIRYRISSQLRDQVLNPEMYALVDMNIVKRFKKSASLALYEFCVRFERVGHTTEVQWKSFRDIMLGESSESKSYQEYKYFKAKVLKPAIAEVNAQADIKVELVEKKVGRSIDNIQFKVYKERPAHLEVVIEDEEALKLVGEMIKIGLPQSEAKKILREYQRQEVAAAIEYTKRRAADKRAKELGNVAAYLRQVLKNGWAVVDEEVSKGKGPERPPKNTGNSLIEGQYMVHQMKEAEGYFKELEPEDQDKLITTYNEQQPMSQLQVKKKTSKGAQTAFFRWLGLHVWGQPSSEELLAFASEMIAAAAKE